jgi:N-methylhydantoinase A
MALAVRGVSVQRGFDPRDFALVAMGGGGPVHVLAIARDLHIPKVVIPNLPAHFSALGMLMSDVRHDFVRTYYRLLEDSDFAELRAIYAELAGAGSGALEQAGVDPSARSFEYFMDLRYLGQEFHLHIPVSADEIERGDRDAIRRRFDETHEQRFSHSAKDEPVELVNVRLTTRGQRPKITFPRLATKTPEALTGMRPIYLDDPTRAIECPVYRRDLLSAGQSITGPCVIEEFGSTSVLFEGDRATVAETGEIIVDVARI